MDLDRFLTWPIMQNNACRGMNLVQLPGTLPAPICEKPTPGRFGW